MIQFCNVNKNYQLGQKTITALKNCSIHIKKGEFVAIMGRSGSGKSTFLKIAGTLEKPDSGIVMLDGTPIESFTTNQICKLRQKKIGFIFQQYQLLPEYTIWDNVCMPLYIAHEPVDEAYLSAVLEHVHLFERRMDMPDQLSGGQQQRVAIARALAAKPKILLADEPTGNLDYHTGQEIMQMLSRVRELYQQTIIMVTHDMESANYADRIIRIEDGMIQ